VSVALAEPVSATDLVGVTTVWLWMDPKPIDDGKPSGIRDMARSVVLAMSSRRFPPDPRGADFG
jgi:hypothetical protein